MNLKISGRNQIYTAAALMAISVIVFFLLALRPQLSRLSSLNSEIKQERANLENAKLTLKRLSAIKEESSKTEAKAIELAEKVPDQSEMPSLLVRLQNVADDSGLDFGSFKVSDEKEENGYVQIPISITVSGSFYDLVDYIYRLENMRRKLSITKLSISSAKNYKKLAINLEITAYHLSSKPGSSPPPPPGKSTTNSQTTGG